MKIDFPRYLAAKYDLDFRSINFATLGRFLSYLEKIGANRHILELGGGIGSMLTYLSTHLGEVPTEYTLIDAAEENIAFVPENIRTHLKAKGFQVEEQGNQKYRIALGQTSSHLHTICTSTENFIRSWSGKPDFDVVVASSYLDIVPVPETLRLLDKVVKQPACLYLPFNYDGLTLFHPVIDRQLDDEIVALYNLSMDNRRMGELQTGGSLTGRKLLDWLPDAGYKITSAGSSDWILTPNAGNYAADEAYFLACILQFIEESVSPLWKNKLEIFENWLSLRRSQAAEGKLSYLAHQIDFMALR